jgi:serine/threonine-protein kinase
MSLNEGTILGDYEIVKPLGQGGMGEVYLARDVALDRPAAIKTIIGSFLDDDMLLRFKREAQSAGKLIHPNIVQIYKVDIESTPPYMAMEFVDGTSLDQKIKESGAYTWQQALTICGQAVSGLACAHEADIVHRDIKPANILMDKNGRVKIADFGLAKMLDSSLKMTQDNQSIGSPCYMSPEHWGTGEIGPASDLFSLGISTYEMIAGRLPFEAKTVVEMMAKVTSQPIPPLGTFAPGVPTVVRQFVETLAARNPDERYRSAREVLEDLTAMQAKQPLPHMTRLRQNGSGQPAAQLPSAEGTNNELTTLADEVTGGQPQSAFHKHVVHEELSFPWMKALAGAAALVAIVVAGGLFMTRDTSPDQFAPFNPVESSQQPPALQQLPNNGGRPGEQNVRNPLGQQTQPLFQPPNQNEQRRPGGIGNNVRPPRPNQEFRIKPNGQLIDAITGNLLPVVQHNGHNVPAIKDENGYLVQAGKNAQGQWVKLGAPPQPPPRRQ